MGSLTFGRHVGGTVDANNKARFWLPDTRYALLAVRVHFRSGTGRAPFVINLDSGMGEDYDMALMTYIPDAGTGADVHFRVAEHEMQHWIFGSGGDDRSRDDRLVFTWTNPDDDTMRWGATVSLYPIDESTPP